MLDFIRLCKELNIPFLESGHHHCAEGWIQTHCPFCSDGTHGWHLGFSLEHGNMNCWRCGVHHVGKFLATILHNRGLSVRHIIKKYSDDTFIPKKKEPKPRPRLAKQPPGMTHLKPIHLTYLKKRNFHQMSIIDEWDLKATVGLSDKWSWRIIAPIRNSSGLITGYAGRAIDDNVRPKWRFSHKEEMSDDPKKMLYGIDKVQDRVLIVEGVSDVWRMGAGAVGVFGIDWKEEQASILKNFSYRFIMFDPEKQAQKKAKELADWLAPFPGDTEIISGLSCDPGDLSQDKADNIMKELGFI